jgi:hypothetical protein
VLEGKYPKTSRDFRYFFLAETGKYRISRMEQGCCEQTGSMQRLAFGGKMKNGERLLSVLIGVNEPLFIT